MPTIPTGPWKRAQTCAQAALAVAVLASPAAHAACKLIRLAELPTTAVWPVIPVSLDGHPAKMLIDTGAAVSFLWHSAAAALHLEQTHSDLGAAYGVGGRTTTGRVTIRQFALGEYVVHNLTLTAFGDSGSAPAANARRVVAGVLGEDFLHAMDLELDPTAAKLRFFEPKGCHGDQVVYWAAAYNMLALRTDNDFHGPVATVLLNGQPLAALFDTGAGRSIVRAAVTTRPGLSPEAKTGSTHVLRGVGPGSVAAYAARFASLTIAQESIRNPTLDVSDLFAGIRWQVLGSHISRSPGPLDMIIGMDFFRAHRVYIARSQGRIYFTYTGGPVFQPPQSPATPAAAGTPAASPQAASPAPGQK